MENIYVILAIIFGLWILQGILSVFQVKNYRKAVRRLSSKGRLLTARQKGKLGEGIIMIFAIDTNGLVLEAEQMRGITVFAKFRPIPGVIGKSIYNDNEIINSLETKIQRKALIKALEMGVKEQIAETNKTL